ncbi:SOS response-associated peptidase family protein [Pseudoxanthomonas sp. PXM02]|uniref:SOS response-associated peptidase family protein n=1 Tax=Pseudoxanthomonas sp. PXM02 TaxID=2769294 RepID=UPI00178593A4|nr:SOS response-associated peptidase family protein [Pseudoxanthomonas sp. PXM02]MBD9478500.1 SOS response-associated peptidase family protein [Pseudoxanthomonas sp. PXM02]
MCYSAQIKSDYNKFLRHNGPVMDLKAFAALWLRENGLEREKVPKGVIDTVGPLLPPEVRAAFDDRFAADEAEWQAAIFKQAKRKADNERKLQTKVTKAASEHVRIAGNKIEQLKGWIADLHRTELKARDWQFFPQWWVPVIVREGDDYVVRPMRYQLRQPGMPASSDFTRKGEMSGTYNARRDNLERFWRHQFGYTHGLMVIDEFWENVDKPGGGSQRIKFRPKAGEPMLVACLWANWTDPEGIEPDMPCFAAITDEPEPEVAAAGHDRTIINIKPEHVEAWLSPDPANLQALYDIFDDKQHPYYEHQIAQAA